MLFCVSFLALMLPRLVMVVLLIVVALRALLQLLQPGLGTTCWAGQGA
jgi:hypothetical protein